MAEGKDGGRGPEHGFVTKTAAGWEARFSPELLVAVYASEELAQRALDILQLKTLAADGGQQPEAVELLLPLQEYMTDSTLDELRTFDLPTVLAAVRSFALGGPRAPRCGVVNRPTGANGGLEHITGSGGGRSGTARVPASRGGTGLAAAYEEDENSNYRGITRDNNGRQQYWIALLYASLDKEKRPVSPSVSGKTSLYIACCKNSHEAAVAHDLAVMWWRVGLSYNDLWEQADRQKQGQGPAGRPGGEGRDAPQEWQQQGDPQPPQEQEGGLGGAGGEGNGGGDSWAGSLPRELVPDFVEWRPEKTVLKQLNFAPDIYASNQTLMRQLLMARTLADLRGLVSHMRNTGSLYKLAAACRVQQHSVGPADGLPPAATAAAVNGVAAAMAVAAAQQPKRPRKPGEIIGPAVRRGVNPRPPAPARDRVVAGSVDVGKHGRLHDKPYMGLVRDRQITLHPWRPMICAMVEGHTKPQPRSLASCSTAEEAAVARDLGWIWLWRRNISLRQHATLNFSLQSYIEHGGTLLDDIANLSTLEALRAYLRDMRDTAKLKSLATTLEHTFHTAAGVIAAGSQRAQAAVGSGGGGAATADAMSTGGLSVGAGSRSRGEGAEDEELDPDVEMAAAEMLHLLEGLGGGGGGYNSMGHSGDSGPAANQQQLQRGEPRGGGSAAASGSLGQEEDEEEDGSEEGAGWDGSNDSSGSGSEVSASESESAEDAGAIDDSGDDDWQAGNRKKKRRLKKGPPRKRARLSPPPGGAAAAGGAGTAAQTAAGSGGPASWPAYQPPQQQQQAVGNAGVQSSALRALLSHPGPAVQPAGGGSMQRQQAATPQRSAGPPAFPAVGHHPPAAAGGAAGAGASTPPAAGPAAALGEDGQAGGDEDMATPGSTGNRFVGVQRIASSKQASKAWIPRPTVRVMEGRRAYSKQLTLCYCDSAEEAAVARDLATVWNWQQLGGTEHGGQQRLNFSLSRYESQPGLMEQLAQIGAPEGMQHLAKELRDSGALRQLAAVLGTPVPGGGQAAGTAGASSAEAGGSPSGAGQPYHSNSGGGGVLAGAPAGPEVHGAGSAITIEVPLPEPL